MKVSSRVEGKIKGMSEGVTFKYEELGLSRSEYSAAAKAIERFIGKGLIKRVSTGVFYKPRRSVFGELRPMEEEMLRPYLFQEGKRIAYITGSMLYNRMGLTSQVPKIIKVASRTKRIITRIGKTQVKPVKSYVEVSEDNYVLLEILDALKDFKIIPDLDKRLAVDLLKRLIGELSDKDIGKLTRYSISYPPRATALLGALLEDLGLKDRLDMLRNSINPLTTYKLGLDTAVLPTALSWNIR